MKREKLLSADQRAFMATLRELDEKCVIPHWHFFEDELATPLGWTREKTRRVAFVCAGMGLIRVKYRARLYSGRFQYGLRVK